ncbi:MAG: PTS sugar transporter subunit IIA [Pseudomonadota bacterium]
MGSANQTIERILSMIALKEVMLKDVLKSSNVLDNMGNRSKRAAIEDLIDLLWKQKQIKNKADALERVLEREDLASTALGGGIAIPHARLEVGVKPVIAMGRHPAGIDFGAPDGDSVRLIFLVLWEPEQPGLFNRLFAGLVSKLADAHFRGELLDLPGAGEIAALLSDVRIDMQAGRASKYEGDMLIALQVLESKRRAGAKGLERQIELARDELPGSQLSRFDRLLSRHGEALVDAPEGICRGCNMQLSSSFASEVLKNPDTIYICEKCGRFLIHHIV